MPITNNLTNQAIRLRNGGQATLTTNVINAQAAWFVDSASGDLSLVQNNPAVIDQGTNLVDVSVDIYQTARPLSANHDIGAFEVSEGSLFANGFESQ